MSGSLISQAEADDLFALEKYKTEEKLYQLPNLGGRLEIPLASLDRHQFFSLDFSRGRIDLSRRKYQNRTKQVIILARLDFNVPHRNPDGKEVGVPHLHLYKEDYNDKWAYEVPKELFTNLDDNWQTILDFINYCSVVDPPNIQKGLFT